MTKFDAIIFIENNRCICDNVLYYKCQEGWETLKDHPIDRAGDLKHRPISGGAPKNAFFISMQNSFKENVRKQLLVAAQEYFSLLTGGKNCIYPKTVLNKNRLDEKKPIIIFSWTANEIAIKL